MYPNQDQPGQPVPQPNYGPNAVPQQHANGQYEVVPPPSVTGRSTGHNPYEFIVNPNTSKPQKLSVFGGNNFLKRIALIIGGAAILMIVAAILLSVLLPNKSSTTTLTEIAQRQQEIIRISTLATTQATTQDTKNYAITVEYAITSSQTKVTNYLAAHGGKINSKVLALKQSTQTDTLLTAATATNTFDSAVTQNIQGQLNDYATDLQNSYKTVSSTTVKQLLQQNFSTVSLLLKTNVSAN